MFELEHHQKIISIVNALDADFFDEIGAYFGGGTLLALAYNEYRLSKDIDFICPVGQGYRQLRAAINEKGYGALFADTGGLEFPRDIKANQYGVRFAVKLDEFVIKFEIVAEGRIALDKPTYYDWCSVPCLSFEDSCAEKLLSNADRWADASVESRDLIDLAVLRLQGDIAQTVYDKAENAYPVIKPLIKAIEKFRNNHPYRERCLATLRIGNSEMINNGIALLAEDHGVEYNHHDQ